MTKMKNNNDPKLEKLMHALRSIEKPKLSDFRKIQIKENILSQTLKAKDERVLSSNCVVLSYIRNLVADLSLSLVDRVEIKNRVFDVIEGKKMKGHFWYRFFTFNKQLVSGALMFFMFFGMFSFVSVDTNVARAGTFTKLSDFEGEVFVNRDGENILPQEGMELYENDTVITGDGEVVIEYFDDSVSRLSGDTEVLINRLWSEGDSNVSTYVEVSVIDGSMWSKVLNLVEDDSFFVVVAKDVYTSAKRGAFNVELDEDDVEVEVYHNTVEVYSQTNDNTEKIVSGYAVTVEDDSEMKVAVTEESQWATENLEEDIVYVAEVEERLLASKMDSLEVNFEEDYSFDNTLRESSLLLVTIDDVKRHQIELDLAEQNFIAAEVKLYDPNLTDEEKAEYEAVLHDFAVEVEQFYEMVDEVDEKELEYAEELDDYVEEKLLTLKKDLVLTLPDSPAYEAKVIVEELELLAVEDETELEEVLEEQALDALADAEDLLVKEPELVEEVVAVEINDLEVVVVEVEVEELVEEEVIDVEYDPVEIIVEDPAWTHYGVEIYGDKPLSPMLY